MRGLREPDLDRFRLCATPLTVGASPAGAPGSLIDVLVGVLAPRVTPDAAITALAFSLPSRIASLAGAGEPAWTPFAPTAKAALPWPLVVLAMVKLEDVDDKACWLVEVTGSDATTGDGILLSSGRRRRRSA